MSVLNPLIVERTTAATDLFLALVAFYFCWNLYSRPVNDPLKRKYWTIMFAFTGLAALLGAIAHGFDMSESTREFIWQPLLLCLGFVIAFFVQGAIHEKWGSRISDQTYTWAVFAAFAFYVLNVIFSGSFILFIGYEALGMLFSLGLFVYLYLKNKEKHLLYLIIAILFAFIAAAVQATQSLHFNFIWPFDHNSSFHLIQIISGVFVFLSLRRSFFGEHVSTPVRSMEMKTNNALPTKIISELDEMDMKMPKLSKEVNQELELPDVLSEKNTRLDNPSNMHTQSSNELKKCMIIDGFSKEQLKRFKKMSSKEKHSERSVIIEDGADANHFYIVESGKVNIVKDGVVLGSKAVNEDFGVMALIDGSRRSADVIASETTMLRSIPFKKILNKKNKDLYQKIISNQLLNQQRDLKRMNVVTIGEVKEKLEESLRREESSKFFISLVFVLVFYQFFLGVFLEWGETLRDRSFLEYLTPIFTIFLGVISVAHALKSRYDLEEYGFTTKNWRKDVPQALLWTAAFLLVLIMLKWVATIIPGPFYGQPVIDTSSLPDFSPWVLVGIYTLYALLVPVQEIVARGVIQTGLLKIFDGGKWALWKAILLSNCMFSAFHLYLDIKFAILTFIPGLFWGYLFSKQSSLIGVSISHIIIGLFALSFLQNY